MVLRFRGRWQRQRYISSEVLGPNRATSSPIRLQRTQQESDSNWLYASFRCISARILRCLRLSQAWCDRLCRMKLHQWPCSDGYRQSMSTYALSVEVNCTNIAWSSIVLLLGWHSIETRLPSNCIQDLVQCHIMYLDAPHLLLYVVEIANLALSWSFWICICSYLSFISKTQCERHFLGLTQGLVWRKNW